MQEIVLNLRRTEKRRLKRWLKKTRSPAERIRILIVLHFAEGWQTHEIARAVHYHPSGIRKVRARFLERGEDGIRDQRVENGLPKIDDDLLAALVLILASRPRHFGWFRTTWMQELLARALAQRTGVWVSTATVSRMLRKLGVRRGQPKPIVLCPWSEARRQRRLRAIRTLVENLPPGEVALYEDEVDIHLNPRIGREWMLPGTQHRVVTPGQNVKRYIAGALDATTGAVHWTSHDHKNVDLFLMLLGEIYRAYPTAKRIHVILDNYSIHKSERVARALAEQAGGRIVLHFLPPYCPDHNRIERLWKDLHDQVTRNHTHATIDGLMRDVKRFLRQATPWPRSKRVVATTAHRLAA